MPLRGGRAAAIVIALMAGQAMGQGSFTFTGAPFTDWHTGSNWNPNGVPGVGAAVGAGAIIQSAPASLGPGTRPVLSSLLASQTLSINNGMTVSGDAALTNMDMRGTDPTLGLVCGGILTLSGASVWRGGIIQASDGRQTGALTIGGPNGTGPTSTIRGVFRNTGGVAMTNRLILDDLCTVTNENNWDLGADLDILTSPSVLFRNIGTLTKTGGASTVRTSFEHTGSLNVDAGTLQLQGLHTTLRGTVTLANNGLLRVWQGLPAGSTPPLLSFTAGGQGNLHLTSGNHVVDQPCSAGMSVISDRGLWIDTGAGTLTLNATLTNTGLASYSGGRIAGGSSFINGPNALLSWGTSGSTSAQLATTLINNGIVLMRGAPRLDFGTVLNGPAATLDVTFGAFTEATATSNQILNQGLLKKGIDSTTNTILGAPLIMQDGALVRVQRHTLSLNRGSTWNGNTDVLLGPDSTSRLVLELGQHLVESGELLLDGSGGSFELSGSASITISGGRITNFLELPAAMNLTGLVTVQSQQGLVNEGHLSLNGGIIDAGAQQGFVNNFEMVAFGTLLGDCSNNGYLEAQGLNLGATGGGAGHLHNAAGAEVWLLGNSSIISRTPQSGILNEGRIVHDQGFQGTISGGTLDNRGTVESRSGALTISPSVVVPQIQNGTLNGGSWEASPGATLNLPQGITIIGQNSRVRGSTQALAWLAQAQVIQGLLILQANSLFSQPLRVAGGGMVQIDPPSQVTVPGSVENGSAESILDEIEERLVISLGPEPRLITPVLRNYARLVPGGHGEPGPFNLTGNLVMQPTGRILVELGGDEPLLEHDRVSIVGAAALDGALHLALIDGFVPSAGQQFTVLTATGGITGAFSSVVPPPGRTAQLLYLPTSVVVQLGCYANCDNSTLEPVLTVQDFTCFLQRYAAGESYANCDNSTAAPILNVQDFTCFLQRYAAGCP